MEDSPEVIRITIFLCLIALILFIFALAIQTIGHPILVCIGVILLIIIIIFIIAVTITAIK